VTTEKKSGTKIPTSHSSKNKAKSSFSSENAIIHF